MGIIHLCDVCEEKIDLYIHPAQLRTKRYYHFRTAKETFHLHVEAAWHDEQGLEKATPVDLCRTCCAKIIHQGITNDEC